MVRASLTSILLTLTVLSTAEAQSRIKGTVTGKEGDSLTGVNIGIIDSYKGSYSDTKGRFSIGGLRPGTYTLKATHVGHKDLRRKVELDSGTTRIELKMKEKELMTEKVTVSGTRVDERDPIPTSTVERARIAEENLAQDMPYVLEHTPSAVATSDAGTGVGYTDLRIRGSAPSRINVTINGIPLNDAESQGVFWVDLPDLAASTDDIQIQRGVGSSTNGAGAFGATVNIKTTQYNEAPYASTSHSYGSFNTRKHNVRFGTGLIGEHWSFEGRLSRIKSDGFIDRAFSDLSSYYFSGSYSTDKSAIRFITFSGKETTYQAWYGMPKASLDTNRTFNPYDYENETDNYTQTHYQLHYDQWISPELDMDLSLHYTKGAGYFEQYKGDDHNNSIPSAGKVSLQNYGLKPVELGDTTIRRTDLVQQRWLDNDFYGLTYAFNYEPTPNLNLTLGGAWNQYLGDHYGKVVWARYMSNGSKGHRFYDNDALKTDFNSFLKAKYQIDEHWRLFGDLQYRRVSYAYKGIDQEGAPLHQLAEYAFINPKGGISYRMKNGDRIYTSYARGSKEPNRTDHVDAPPNSRPKAEHLNNYELGYEHKGQDHAVNLNLYYMDYKDQLVQTGKVNDVGRSIRVNVPDSYRRGAELQAGWRPFGPLDLTLNATYSQNRIEKFTEFVDDFDEGGQRKIERKNTTIAFSPQWIGAGRVEYTLLKQKKKERGHQLSLKWDGKYVGEQYIDNTGSEERKLGAYFVQDLSLNYDLQGFLTERIELRFRVKNLFDTEYVSEAWSYRFYSGGQFQHSAGYFPQAGRHYIGSATIHF